MSNSHAVVDVSKYNMINNYNQVANSVEGMIIRAGYRAYRSGELKVDPLFETHIENAIKAKIPVGIYFFTTAVNAMEGAQEADFAVSLIKKYKLSFPIFVDTEMSNNNHDGRSDKINKTVRTEAVVAFCERIKQLGYVPGIYASDSWFVTQLEYEKVKSYKLWVASYSRTPYRVPKYTAWQYSSKEIIPGITGRVDMSHWYESIGNPVEKDNIKRNPYLKPSINVKKGMKGEAVKWLQYELNEEGNKLIIDGIFGNNTLRAVKAYQKKMGLVVDGIVGPITIAELVGQSTHPVSGPNILAAAAIMSAGAIQDENPRFELKVGGKFIVPCANMYMSWFGVIPIRTIHGECEILSEKLKNGKLHVRTVEDGTTYTGWFKWVDIYDLFI